MPSIVKRDNAVSDATVAILMDYENARDANLQRVLQEAAAFGRVIIRRAYADWTRYAKAANSLREAGFEELHQFTSGSGTKNATDIHLAVDAMDILYTRPVDCFMLVTADSDFAKLARRLREGGKRVIGMGAKKRVGRALVQSCDQFIYYDIDQTVNSVPVAATSKAPEAQAAPAAKPAQTQAQAQAPQGGRGGIGKNHRFVLEALAPAADDEGIVYGGPLHESIRRVHPDFSYRDLGFSSFLRFIESLAPIIRLRRDPEASDFAVWIDPQYEKQVPAAVRTIVNEPEPDLALDSSVQEHIHKEWLELMGDRKRLAGSRAAAVVAHEYGVDRLGETPLKDLQGVLDASPILSKRWRRDKASLIPRS